MAEEETEPQTVHPFKIIHRGDDTLGEDDDIIFADFSPQVVPADTPEDVDEVLSVPKAGSAPAPAPSSESTETTEQTKSENPVQTPVDEGAGNSNLVESSRPSSSSTPKSG